jgi:hypothetical protein
MMPSISALDVHSRVPPGRTLARYAIAAALALPALLPGLAYADPSPRPPSVPAPIQVPAGNDPFLLGHASGTQRYMCQPSSSGYAWTFVAPSATLVDDKDKPITTHFAGPTWQARDGSAVVGARVEGVTVSTSAIPWLLLRATSTTTGPDGGDRLTGTTYIQRVNTTGGLAPVSGCDATTAGTTTDVPYTSDYYFYRNRYTEPDSGVR